MAESVVPVQEPDIPAIEPTRHPFRLLVVFATVAAIIVGGAIAAIFALGASSSSRPHARTRSAAVSTPAHPTTRPATTNHVTSATGSSGARVMAQITLNPPSGGSAKGIAEVLRDGGKTGIAIAAQGLRPNSRNRPNAYAVWLSNSPRDSRILGFVNPAVGSNGQLKTAGGLPTNASHYQKLLVTLETASNPTVPGTIVLEGTLTGVS